jgi:DNA-binding CsgD family transcriptional regulator
MENTCCRVMVISVASGEPRFTLVNDTALRDWGRSVSDLRNKPLTDIAPASHYGPYLKLIEGAAATGAAERRCGMWFGSWRRVTIRPIEFEGGRREILLVSAPADCRGETAPVERSHDFGDLGALTRREFEILRLLGTGLGLKGIAGKLHRSVKTIEHHRTRLSEKLGVGGLLELALLARDRGLAFIPESQVERVASQLRSALPTTK